jgi:hypothetical protein
MSKFKNAVTQLATVNRSCQLGIPDINCTNTGKNVQRAIFWGLLLDTFDPSNSFLLVVSIVLSNHMGAHVQCWDDFSCCKFWTSQSE